jgi:hypothetical protein
MTSRGRGCQDTRRPLGRLHQPSVEIETVEYLHTIVILLKGLGIEPCKLLHSLRYAAEFGFPELYKQQSDRTSTRQLERS